MARIPYGRLSAFYFLYFSTLGSFLPYWGIYLKSLDLDPRQIGELVAVLVGTKVVAPLIWGWIADFSGRGVRVIRVASLCAVMAFVLVFFSSTFEWLLMVTVLFSFFWNATLPQFEAITLSHLGKASHDYSRIRLWGSIGFVVTVLVVGLLLDYFSVSLLPVAITLCLLSIWVASLLVPEAPGRHPEGEVHGLGRILRRPEIIGFLLVVCLVQVAHGPYYVFYSIYLEDLGYSGAATGALWALGVIAEILLFYFMHLVLARISLHRLLLLSILLGVLRWGLTGCCADSLILLVGAQILHAATFGSTHVAAIHIVHQTFPSPHHGKAQAIYSGLSFGLGGMIGSYVSGWIWSDYTPNGVFYFAAGVSMLAVLILAACREIGHDTVCEEALESVVEEDL